MNAPVLGPTVRVFEWCAGKGLLDNRQAARVASVGEGYRGVQPL